MKDIIVIGGGPAGMMAAITAQQNGANVLLIEKNKMLGKKLLITGKGRCNVTNDSDEQTFLNNVVHNSKFLYSAIYRFSAKNTMDFFEKAGVALKVERGARVFPVSDQSSDIRDALKKELLDCGVSVVCDTAVSIKSTEDSVEIFGENDAYFAQKCIIATGGISYPETGCTGDGYKFARSIGHGVTDLQPSLIGLKCYDDCCHELAGLTLKNVAISVTKKGKYIYKDFGELLFTHVGVSGPTVLSASAHIIDFDDTVIHIDLKPALDFDQLDKRILRDINENTNKDVLNAFGGLLPKRLLPIALDRAAIPFHCKANQITKSQRLMLCNSLHDFTLRLKSKEGIAKAVITRGGVMVNDISPNTMASRLNDRIYFAGEVLDVDAYTGGFNLQIAFSTGYLAGLNAAKGVLSDD